MDFPTDEQIATLETFPLSEGRTLEFKASWNCAKMKLAQTVCAFLNMEGGHMVVGVHDETLAIHGIRASKKEMDSILLQIDDIYHHQLVYSTDGAPLHKNAIKARFVARANGGYVLVISATKDEVEREYVTTSNGDVGLKRLSENAKIQQTKHAYYYVRLMASNYCTAHHKLYTRADLENELQFLQRATTEQYKALLKDTTEILKKNKDAVNDKQQQVFRTVLEKKKLEAQLGKTKEDVAAAYELLHKHILAAKDKAEASLAPVESVSICTFITNLFAW